MFDIQIRLTVNGRPVAAQEFIGAFLQELARAARSETNMPLPALQAPGPLPTSTEVRRTREAKPLAVGITEAARLVGLSPWTIRKYIGSGRIKAVRIGRRVLVPMEALEKVLEEGVKR